MSDAVHSPYTAPLLLFFDTFILPPHLTLVNATSHLVVSVFHTSQIRAISYKSLTNTYEKLNPFLPLLPILFFFCYVEITKKTKGGISMKTLLKCIFIILLTFHLCACGAESAPGQPTPAPHAGANASGQDSVTGTNNHSGFDMSETPLAVERYLPLFLPEEPAEYVSRQLLTDTYGSILYLFAVYTYAEAEPTYMLYTFDANTLETKGAPYHFSVPEDAAYYVDSMDVIDELTLSFHLSMALPEEEATTYLYQGTPAGECLLLTDALPEASSYPWNAPWGTSLVFDNPQTGTYVVKSDDDSTECQISLFNKDTLSSQVLASLPTQCLALCDGTDNTIYYSDSQYIVRYDMSAETGVCLAALSDCGILGNSFCHLLRTDDNQLVYVVLRGHTPGIYLLAESDRISNTAAATLHMVNLADAYGSQYAVSMASLLSTRSDHLDIQVETAASTTVQENMRDRIIAEMIAGKGPDLLLVSAADFLTLAEKGLLLDITPAIEKDTRQEMFGSVLDLGSVNDTLYALPQNLSYHTLVTSDAVWDKDSWTVEDVTALLEKSGNHANPILFFGRKVTSSELLSKILLPDLENSPFLDFEKGICYFDSEAFIHILELCKQYGAPTLESTEYISGRQKMLAQGEIITSTLSLYDGLASFSQTMNEYGPAVHIVGFPDRGTEILSSTYLVVNARTTEYSAVKEYLNFLLSYENQYTLVHPVRKDVFENRLTKDPVSGMYYMPLTLDNSNSAQIQPKPNGDSYLEDYLAFLENAKPADNSHPAVWDIIYQELNAYLNSGKSARDTAAVIQSRVQIYLDENAS